MFIFSVVDKSKLNQNQSANDSTNHIGPDDVLKKTVFNSIKKGDLNKDGEITNEDYHILDDVLHYQGNDPTKLNDEQKKAADMNSNGKLGEDDLYAIGSILYQQEFDSVKINPKLPGDFNSDGKFDDKDFALLCDLEYTGLGLIPGRTLTNKQFKAADLNHDGVLNGDDLVMLETKYNKPTDQKPNQPQSQDSKDQSQKPQDKNTFGDLNFDGKVDFTDLDILVQGINLTNPKDKLSKEQEAVADINGDGKVDFSDIGYMDGMVQYRYFNSINPSDHVAGDMNNDGIVDNKDLKYFLLAETFSKIFANILSPEQKVLYDLNSDNKIDDKDIAIFKKYFMNEKPLELKPPAVNDPKNWMISQVRGPTNLNADSPSHFNSNCTATSLLMVARMFGKMGGGPAEAQGQIDLIRKLSGSIDAYSGISDIELGQVAKELGLTAEHAYGDISKITSALKQGKKVILSVNPAKYSPSKDSSHAIVVTGVKGDNFIINDPGFQKPIIVSKKALTLAMKQSRGKMLILGNTKKTTSTKK